MISLWSICPPDLLADCAQGYVHGWTETSLRPLLARIEKAEEENEDLRACVAELVAAAQRVVNECDLPRSEYAGTEWAALAGLRDALRGGEGQNAGQVQ